MNLAKTAVVAIVVTAVLASGCRHFSIAEKGDTQMALTKDVKCFDLLYANTAVDVIDVH